MRPVRQSDRRQSEREFGSLAGLAGDADLAPVRGDDFANDRQAQPGASGMASGRHAIKFLEKARQVLGGNSFAIIFDLEPRVRAVAACTLTCTVPPRLVCWIALTIRLSKTCSIRSRSTMTVGIDSLDLGGQA